MASGEPGTAAPSTLPTRRRTLRRSAGPAPAGAAAPSRSCASSRWWRTVRMCCLPARWRAMGRARSRSPKPCSAGWRPACCAWRDRQFFGFALWSLARGSGADLLWRVRKNMRLVPDRRLPDGSYLSTIYPSGTGSPPPHRRAHGAGDRLPVGGCRRRRTVLSAPHHDPRPRRGAGA